MLSTDNGKTWKAAATEDSQPAGGHTNPYGPTCTGTSGDTPDAPTWRHETLDLTPYTGQKLWIRFEYLTDDAITLQGMMIDGISIPEINVSDNMETGDGGWQAEGWVRVENVLPQRYSVQLVEHKTDGTIKVSRLLSPLDGAVKGNWPVKVGGDVDQIYVVVSALTEFTTELAPFTLSFTPDTAP